MTPREAIHQLAEKYVPPIYKRIAIALAERPMTAPELVACIHAHPASVHKALVFMRQFKAVYIKAYERAEHGPFIKYYSLGASPDAERPALITQAERTARWKAKGNDQHRARKIKAQMATLPARMTMAGMLGV